MYALEYSRVEIASYLIDIGSDINARNIYNVTPLHYACKSSHAEDMFEIIKKMLE
jgi:ankyrin repeat protein